MQENANKLPLTEIDYDPEFDTIFFYANAKYKETHVYDVSINYGNIIIDLDANNFIVGIEFLGATEELEMTSEQLSNIKDVKMKYKKGILTCEFKIDKEKMERDINLLRRDRRH